MKQFIKAVPGKMHSIIYTDLESGDILTEEKCIQLARKRKVELEVCLSDLGQITYLPQICNPLIHVVPDFRFA